LTNQQRGFLERAPGKQSLKNGGAHESSSFGGILKSFFKMLRHLAPVFGFLSVFSFLASYTIRKCGKYISCLTIWDGVRLTLDKPWPMRLK